MVAQQPEKFMQTGYVRIGAGEVRNDPSFLRIAASYFARFGFDFLLDVLSSIAA
jgi:hypothetical protein